MLDPMCNIVLHQKDTHRFRCYDSQGLFIAKVCRFKCVTHHITFRVTHAHLMSEVEKLPASLMLYALPRTLITPAFVKLVCIQLCYNSYNFY